MSEQDLKAGPNHRSDMPTTEEGNGNIVSCDPHTHLSDTEKAENCDGSAKPALLEKSDGLEKKSEPVCADDSCDDEIEAGEISSPKGGSEEEGEKTFAVECELDFENDEGERAKERENELADVSTKKITEESGDGADDGECTDGELVDEDLEEGELKDESVETTSKPNPPTKTVCRYFNRGQCFYSNNCRFLHVNLNVKTGNYSMFAPTRVGFADGFFDPAPAMGHGMNRRGPPPIRTGPDFPPVPPLCPEAPPAEPLETAWEKALRDAKELVKKANKRKVEDSDFDVKRLNLSLAVNEKNIPEIENEMPFCKKKKRENSAFLKREYDESYGGDIYNDGYESRPHIYSRDHFDNNMEIRYEKELRFRGRSRMGDREQDKFPKSPDEKNKERFRDDRLQVPSRSRVDEYFDPWRRSKSPKGGNIRRTRSRSGSYSSVSSYSYSSRSSRGSRSSHSSYSRSSSSSRSPHPHQKRTPSPKTVNPAFASPKMGPNKFTTMKNKPGGRPFSSRSSMSRSRSRSFSRSISMDSVSSASSSSSHSGHQISHTSILRKQENPPATVEEKPAPAIDGATVSNPPAVALPNVYLNYNAPCKVEKTKETPKEEPPIIEEDERDPLEEKFLTPVYADVPFPSLQHLLPTNDKVKEPFKGMPHKQQIKLTLLNKTPKLNNMPKKELDVNRKQNDESSKPVGIYPGVKGPSSPPVPPVIIAKPAPVLVPKKSASNRRDELLKQLKAVEDAIARKRAKFG